jgi:hypothetical protein
VRFFLLCALYFIEEHKKNLASNNYIQSYGRLKHLMLQADARVLSLLAQHWVSHDESLLFLSALKLANVAA